MVYRFGKSSLLFSSAVNPLSVCTHQSIAQHSFGATFLPGASGGCAAHRKAQFSVAHIFGQLFTSHTSPMAATKEPRSSMIWRSDSYSQTERSCEGGRVMMRVMADGSY